MSKSAAFGSFLQLKLTHHYSTGQNQADQIFSHPVLSLHSGQSSCQQQMTSPQEHTALADFYLFSDADWFLRKS